MIIVHILRLKTQGTEACPKLCIVCQNVVRRRFGRFLRQMVAVQKIDNVRENRRCFALRVRGDSMIGAGILSGDKVVVRPQLTAENGQIVVALLDDSATVKRFRREKGKVWLLPENPAYDPIDGTDCSIIGLVKAVYREY